MLRTVQTIPAAPIWSTIDLSTVQADFKPAVLGTNYELSEGNTKLTRIGSAGSSSRCFEVTGKPRPNAKCFVRVKFNASSYAVILISSSMVTANNQLAWTTVTLAADVWHEVKVEHVSGNTYKYTVNGSVLYQGTATHLTFYGHSSVNQISIDAGQQGFTLPAGFEWL